MSHFAMAYETSSTNISNYLAVIKKIFFGITIMKLDSVKGFKSKSMHVCTIWRAAFIASLNYGILLNVSKQKKFMQKEISSLSNTPENRAIMSQQQSVAKVIYSFSFIFGAMINKNDYQLCVKAEHFMWLSFSATMSA